MPFVLLHHKAVAHKVIIRYITIITVVIYRLFKYNCIYLAKPREK